MILDVDVGNTRLKWRLLGADRKHIDAGISQASVDFLRDIKKTFDSLAVVRVACVSRQAIVEDIRKVVAELWSITPKIAVTQKKYAGLEVAYQDPSRLGVDRWLAMLAAYSEAGQAVCVIDCGSAITVDLVNACGKHRGGYIVPGLAMQRTSLLSSTKQIRLDKTVEKPLSGWGRSTEEAVENGLLRQACSFIDDIVNELNGSEKPPVFFITGGDGQQFLSLISHGERFKFNSDLVMDGLEVAFPALSSSKTI